ncbi:NAD(P)-binding domain-containing protein [Mycoplasma sp. U97]|uniref:NAD(P)H-dependent glycerol-3-phosphate dehydrogenase n=1 Tax=Mycoplasma tauri TaxID=547987 RepID=UPI001CBF02CF|nr:NAD(P)H-dependent glycerol-3-phosphate dehydrogenase [Mycoplasma tauri]MBZ4212793.1 NAD(P)-binding domain-containing protein [Mycoplasma tauri]
MIKKITFIGSGSWGSALANVLSSNNHKVTLWGIDKSEIEDINSGINSKYFGNKKFDNEKNIKATIDLSEALSDFDYLVLSVPSAAILPVLKQIKEIIKDKKIKLINVAKGIESKSKKFFSNVLKDEFGDNIENYCTIIGPSFATEVFDKCLTMVNIVGPNKKFLREVSSVFNNDYFRTITNIDEKGSELFAAIKNVLAIGIGIISSIYTSENTQAALLAIGIKEIHNVYKKIEPKGRDNLGFELAGVGDIFLTCSSPKSRNFKFGQDIAELGFKKAFEKNLKTVEGYFAAKILEEIIHDLQIDVPFLKSIIDVMYHDKKVENLLDFISSYK